MEQMFVCVHTAELNALADRIFVRPIPPRQRLADYRDVWRIDGVAAVEQASAQKRNSHRGEVACARRRVSSLALQLRIVIDQKRSTCPAAGQRQRSDAAGG